MYTLRRWWERYWLQLILACLALGCAWGVRQTQGAVIFEVYQSMSRPFQSGPGQLERLSDAKILELQERVVELESQNQKLKELLGYVDRSKLSEKIVAPVVGRSPDHWWQQIMLGRGSEDGIKPGFVVMAPGGLVGRIESVTPHTSQVLLISDPTSSVGVTISRSRYMGFIQGLSNNYVKMQFFDKVPNVKINDAVSTSAYSQLFPPGLPVGQVRAIDLNKSPAPEALIELSAPMRDLEWVICLPPTKQ